MTQRLRGEVIINAHSLLSSPPLFLCTNLKTKTKTKKYNNKHHFSTYTEIGKWEGKDSQGSQQSL